jgi:hypothetical protein
MGNRRGEIDDHGALFAPERGVWGGEAWDALPNAVVAGMTNEANGMRLYDDAKFSSLGSLDATAQCISE